MPRTFRSGHSAVAGKDRVLAIDQDGSREAETLDGVGDLADLLSRMGAGIFRPGTKGGYGENFDLGCRSLCGSSRNLCEHNRKTIKNAADVQYLWYESVRLLKHGAGLQRPEEECK